MVALKLSNFGGMIPAVDSRLLPPNMSGSNSNAWVYSGAVEGFREPTEVYTVLNSTTRKVYRIPKQYYDKEHIPDSYWLEFPTPDVDVIRSPTVGDQYERYYWAGDVITPTYNTKARIAVGSSAYLLGVPGPTVAPGVSVAGGVAPVETRAYVYTRVSAFGEEGPPSPPTSISGNASGTWNITMTAVGAAATGRNLSFTRIYRTVTGTSGSTAFFFVAQVAIGTLTYADTNATSVVTGNGILKSTFWTPPPATLQGMVAMPNGILAGWVGGDVWFSEPYQPHAWPSTYTLALETPIIGMGVMGQSLIVCTSGTPYTISGVNPASMAVSRIAAYEPCLSRGSIISTPMGVAYASTNGLAVAVPGAVQIVTRNIITKDLWLDPDDYLSVPSLRAAPMNGGYYCWGSVLPGCYDPAAFNNDAFLQQDFTGSYVGAYIDINDPRVSYNRLFSADPTYNCYADTWTGEVILLRGSKVYWMDLSNTRPHEPYVWRSKTLETPDQRCFGAMRVYFTRTGVPPSGPMITGSWDDGLYWDDSGNWFDKSAPTFGVVRVYADGILRFTRSLVNPGEIFKLPSGFKATFWEIEVEANIKLNSIEIATTSKELGSV